jgi:hypothetical protein
VLFDGRIAAAYLAGTSSGAALTAVVAWILSGFAEPLPEGARVALLAVGAVLVWATKHGALAGRVTLPEARRQIPAQVFGGSLAAGAYRFGFELGTGVRTHLPSAAPYVLLLILLLARPTLAGALLVGLGFGFGRALPIVVQLAPKGAARVRRLLHAAHPAAATLAAAIVLAGGLVIA